jgi:hypothetical protein
MITLEVEKFLLSSGYEYYCFISWPRSGNRELTECAKRLKEEIENGLKSIVDAPKVFIDDIGLKGGDEWERIITKALCKSIAMVAICAPIYYHSVHKWCGLEWAGMDMLSRIRFPNEDFTSVIPVIVRTSDTLPKSVSKKQYIDISRVLIQGRRYYTTIEFRKKVEEILKQIQKIASCIAKYQIKANCEEFKLPAESAFLDYHTENQSLPFRGKQ